MLNLFKILFPCRFNEKSCNDNNLGCKCGKTSQPSAPAAPDPQQTADAAIQAQLKALPQIVAAQGQYGPQMTQQELESLQKFGPQFAQANLDLQNQFGGQYAQSAVDVSKILSPEAYAAQNQLTKYFQDGPPQLNAEQQRNSIQAVTSNAATRGLAESGFTATQALSTLIDQEQSLKTNFMNQALNAVGRTTNSAQGSVNAASQAFGPGQLVQNVSPQDIFGYQSGLNTLNQNAYQFGVNNPKQGIFDIKKAIGGGLKGFAATGSPWGAVAGATTGGFGIS